MVTRNVGMDLDRLGYLTRGDGVVGLAHHAVDAPACCIPEGTGDLFNLCLEVRTRHRDPPYPDDS